MAFLGEEFRVDDLPEGASYEALPDGWYQVIIDDCELKVTQSGTGQYLKIKYRVASGEKTGRTVFGNINIQNQSLKAEEIGRQQLRELLLACGMASVRDSDELIGKNLSIKLTVKPARVDAVTGASYEASNEVRGFKALEGAAMPAAFSAPAQRPSQTVVTPQSSPATPPWARK